MSNLQTTPVVGLEHTGNIKPEAAQKDQPAGPKRAVATMTPLSTPLGPRSRDGDQKSRFAVGEALKASTPGVSARNPQAGPDPIKKNHRSPIDKVVEPAGRKYITLSGEDLTYRGLPVLSNRDENVNRRTSVSFKPFQVSEHGPSEEGDELCAFLGHGKSYETVYSVDEEFTGVSLRSLIHGDREVSTDKASTECVEVTAWGWPFYKWASGTSCRNLGSRTGRYSYPRKFSRLTCVKKAEEKN